MEIVFLLFVAAVALEFMGWIKKRLKTKLVYVVEDNESDIQLLKLNLEVPDCAFKYYRSLKDVRHDLLFMWRRPDAVIVDYHLDDREKGTELLELCKINRIPSLLVTGDERDILGVSKERILRKSPDKEYFKALESWTLHCLR
ncbi:response regulator [Flavobacteriaceae bacterium]|nr:response regulator [Flavobacteriaceae bacterium]